MYQGIHGHTCAYIHAGSVHVHPFPATYRRSTDEGARIRLKKKNSKSKIPPNRQSPHSRRSGSHKYCFDRANPPFESFFQSFFPSKPIFPHRSFQPARHAPIPPSLPALPLSLRLSGIFQPFFSTDSAISSSTCAELSLTVFSLFSRFSRFFPRPAAEHFPPPNIDSNPHEFRHAPHLVRTVPPTTLQYISAMYRHVRQLYVCTVPVEVHQISYRDIGPDLGPGRLKGHLGQSCLFIASECRAHHSPRRCQDQEQMHEGL